MFFVTNNCVFIPSENLNRKPLYWNFKAYFISVCLFLGFTLSAQETQITSKQRQIDSLKALIKLSKNNALVDRLNTLGEKYLDANYFGADYTQIENSRKCGLKALELSKKLNYQNGLAVSSFLLGKVEVASSNYKDAIIHLKAGAVIAKQLGRKKLEAGIQRLLGNIYNELGDFKKALELYHYAQNIFEALHDSSQLARSYRGIGIVNTDTKNYLKAIESYSLGLDIMEKIHNKDGIILFYGEIANTYHLLRQLDKSIQYYDKALRLKGDTLQLPLILSNLGTIYLEKGNYGKALSYCKEANKVFEKTGNTRMKIANSVNIARINLKQGKNNDALSAMLKLTDSVGYNFSPFDIKPIYEVLYDIYTLKNDYKQANYFLEKCIKINDSLYNAENARSLLNSQVLYETENQEKEIELLKKNEIIQQGTIRSQNTILVFTVCLALLAILILALIVRSYSRRKKNSIKLNLLNEKLITQKDEITQINHLLQMKILRAQMNPHFIYNCLNSLNMLVVKNQNNLASEYVLKFAKMLRMALDFSDKSYTELEDEIIFLKLYLEIESLRMGDNFVYKITVDNELLQDDISVPSLLIQPFVENSIWHGLTNKEGEKKINIHFLKTTDSNHVRCIVEDNGIGRSKNEELGSNQQRFGASKGIKIVKERVELLKFKVRDKVSFEITDLRDEFDKPSGTKVELTFPIDMSLYLH